MSFTIAPAQKSPRAIGVFLAALVFVVVLPATLAADTTLNSGTTTVSTGTNFGVNLYVATTGTATLNVIGGGNATNTTGYVGDLVGSVGTATVSGGTWANSGDLWIGNNGAGTLNVSGGSVTNTIGYVGNNASSVGTATVSSGTWANNGDLFIGNNGTGTLSVSGGKVTNSTGVLGYAAGSVGTATITGGTWANGGNLLVGYSGTGTLTISGSGLVSVSGTLSKGTSGAINLNSGGTLQIGVGGAGGVLDVAALTNNGTLIFNHSNASTYSGIISGTGSVKKQGGGQLTLNGANSYTGLTTISGGTIALSGTGSIGTGGLNLGSGGVFDIVALTSSTYSLPSTGNLTGSGTLSGNGHTLAVLGSFLPGTSLGTVTVDTGLVLDLSGATSTIFDITNPLFTPGTYDLVNGNGSVHFGSVLSLNFSGGAYNNGTDVLKMFANTGGFTGSFSSVNSSGLALGQFATFDAFSGFISIVPEPSTYALAAIGAGVVGLMHRRKRATAKVAAAAAGRLNHSAAVPSPSKAPVQMRRVSDCEPR